MTPVRFHSASENRKLAPQHYERVGRFSRPSPAGPFVSDTYVSIAATCPASCPFFRAGCFADSGFTRKMGERLDDAARWMTGTDVANAEADALDHAFGGGPIPQDGARGGRDLRLHVGGDVANATAAAILAAAAKRWRARGGGTVWTYTHRWREVPRSAWGDAITVFASVESARDMAHAIRRGYQVAITVSEFPDRRAFRLTARGAKIIPCPAETSEATCAECRLCLDRDLTAMGAAIGFAFHGASTPERTRRLLPLYDERRAA